MGLRVRLIAMLVIVMVLAFVLLLVGVNFGLRSDVQSLARQSVDAGSSALAGAIAAREEQIRSAILQGSAQTELARALAERNRRAIASAAADIAVANNLSFVVVTDPKGAILAGSRDASGSLAGDPVVTAGEAAVAGGVQKLDAANLAALGVASRGAAVAIAIASPVNVNGSAVGVLYGGEVINATTKFVDDVARFTGGATGIVLNGRFVDTSIQTKEGVKETGLRIAHATEVANRRSVSATETIDGIQYFAKTAPLTGFEGSVIGATWFAVPFSQFEGIVENTLRQIVIWGIIGLGIALVAGTVVASRIGRAIVTRSEEVNESARQLRVLVVGSEVSGDHVSRTRQALEEIVVLAQRGGDGAALHALARTAVDDVVVIDTLTVEMSNRMRDAAERVERLSQVARDLDALVAGARPSSN